MNTELDEVYVASIKEMFKEFDDEIIWTAIFEHGYNSDNTYNLENVVNYLLELSTDTTKEISKNPKKNENSENIKNSENIENSKNDSSYDKFIIPASNINENSALLDLEEDIDEAQELKPGMFQNITDLILNNNNGYQKIEDK
tara:strand:+ start:98 stop:526 length:429 start_codon:yes stop_codon:yes gene_type:complete